MPHALYYVSIGGDYFEFRPFNLCFPLAFLIMTVGAARLGRATALLGAALALYALVWLPMVGHRAIGSLDPMPTMGESVERLRASLASPGGDDPLRDE